MLEAQWMLLKGLLWAMIPEQGREYHKTCAWQLFVFTDFNITQKENLARERHRPPQNVSKSAIGFPTQQPRSSGSTPSAGFVNTVPFVSAA
jgi:hypothetical protein